MTEQQYTVIADRSKGDDPETQQIETGDRLTSTALTPTVFALDRIERPVPTTDEPTHEQIAEAWDRAREDSSIPRKRNGGMQPVDAFEAGFRSALALIEKGTGR